MDTVCTITKDGAPLNFGLLGAKYLSYNYTPSDLDPVTLWAEKSLTPLYFETVQKYDRLELNFAFRGANIAGLSLFAQALSKCTVTLTGALTAGKVFECILRDNELQKAARNVHTVKYTFDALTFGSRVTETVTSSSPGITVGGAKQTEAVVTFENKTGSVIQEAAVNEYRVTSLSAGEVFIIDGEKKLVTSGGVNVWKRVDFINFPRLNAGWNPLTVTGGAAVTVSYRERW